jgi:REase_MTES_1575
LSVQVELSFRMRSGIVSILSPRVHVLGAGLFDFVNAFHIMIQPTMRLKGKTIRPDLAIWVPADSTVKIIVECDGFDYHSDPTAFQRDRIRDRHLMEAGFRVRRYCNILSAGRLGCKLLV